MPQPFANHNGVQIRFGTDRYLYIALGDGGSAGDPHGNGQNLSSMLGKILRLDPNQIEPGLAYRIPSDTPLRGKDDRREIHAYGPRNPWRFSFDLDTGILWAPDVGLADHEQINTITKGGNYSLAI